MRPPLTPSVHSLRDPGEGLLLTGREHRLDLVAGAGGDGLEARARLGHEQPEIGLATGEHAVDSCALLVRESVPQVDLATLRYVGFRIPDHWVVGYGLDASQRWRGLPDVRIWNTTN